MALDHILAGAASALEKIAKSATTIILLSSGKQPGVWDRNDRGRLFTYLYFSTSTADAIRAVAWRKQLHQAAV